MSVGFLKSTPINVMEFECVEPPLQLRRQMLSDRLLLKIHTRNLDALQNIHSLTILGLTGRYWRVKKLPLLVESYMWISQFKEEVHQSEIPPGFIPEYSAYEILPRTILTDFKDNGVSNNAEFKFIVNQNWSNYELIFTDGSLINNKTGCAMYHDNKKVFRKYQLPRMTSIYTAELTAIREAIRYCIEYEDSNQFVIFTDSKSAVTKIQHLSPFSETNHIISDMIQLYKQLEQQNKTLDIVWIKGHAGIIQNEYVDKLAKEATESGETIPNFKIPRRDVNPTIKKRLKEAWFEHFQRYPAGEFYKNLQACPKEKPWFHDEINRPFIRTTCRLRSSHCLYPVYLFRMGLKEDPYCICGETGHLQHCFMECTRKKQEITDMFSELARNEVPLPSNLPTLLAMESRNVYKILYKFVMENNIKL